MNRYIYIVTRICKNVKHGTPVPNLGVHTSWKSAKEHFEAIVEDRQSIGYTLLYDRLTHPMDNLPEQREAYLKLDYETEELRLERWRI